MFEQQAASHEQDKASVEEMQQKIQGLEDALRFCFSPFEFCLLLSFIFFRFSFPRRSIKLNFAFLGLPMKRPLRKQSGCNRSWPRPKKDLKAKWPSCKRRAKPRTGACLACIRWVCAFVLCCCVDLLQNWTFLCRDAAEIQSDVRALETQLRWCFSLSLHFPLFVVCCCGVIVMMSVVWQCFFLSRDEQVVSQESRQKCQQLEAALNEMRSSRQQPRKIFAFYPLLSLWLLWFFLNNTPTTPLPFLPLPPLPPSRIDCF